jgi:gamma-glutamyltranspeptidase/glutathione hydrolase
LYYDSKTKKVTGLNGSGKSASQIEFTKVKSQFPKNTFKIPREHGLSVTVPGICAGWIDFLDKFGTKTIGEVLEPAIKIAQNGIPISEITAYWWNNLAPIQIQGDSCFLPPPKTNERFFNKDLANTLQIIAKQGKKGFYQGEIATKICRSVKERGGLLDEDDFVAHSSEFVEPVQTKYRNGYDIYECPPNGQGLVSLMSLDMLQSFPSFKSIIGKRGSAQHLHLLIECLRTSFADARRYIADPRYMSLSAMELLTRADIVNERKSRIDLHQPKKYPGGQPMSHSNTVSFQVVDQWGNAVSMVNSTYEGFGSGICPPKLGLSLQNRGSNFSLNEDSPNRVDGGKRPYHTIIPGMSLYSSDQSLHTTFTVMGGFMQPQGHLQVISNLIDWEDNPQEALDAPRFCILAGSKDSDNELTIAIEEGHDEQVIKELREKFHQKITVLVGTERALFGRGQIIMRRKDGILQAGSDPRADGCAVPGF